MPEPKSPFSGLREKAERLLDNRDVDVSGAPSDDVRRLLHELQVHQAELEIQNEELRDAQNELEASRHYYSQLYNHAPVGYLAVDGAGIILQANRTFSEMLGEDVSDIVRKPLSGFIGERDRGVYFSRFKAFFKMPEDKTLNVHLVGRGGTEVFARLEGRVVSQAGMMPGIKTDALMLLMTVSDVTSLKRTEAALQRSEERYRDFFNNMGDAVFLHDLSGRMLDVNPVACERLGYTREELLRMSVSQLSASDSDALVPRRMQELALEGMLVYETAHMTRGGAVIPTQLNCRIVEHEGSKAVLSVARDISDWKRARETLEEVLNASRKREAEVSALLEGAHMVLDALDADAAIRGLCAICKELTGAAAAFVAVTTDGGRSNKIKHLDLDALPCSMPLPDFTPVCGLRDLVYGSRMPVLDNDFMRSEWARLLPKGHIALESVLIAPLVIHDRVLGLLGLANKPGGFTEEDLKMARAFGEQAAIACHNGEMLDALRFRVRFEETLTMILTGFINLRPEHVDEQITAALRSVGQLCGADRCMVLLNGEKDFGGGNIYEWCAAGVAPRSKEMADFSLRRDISYLASRMSAGEIVHFHSLAELPPEADADRAFLEKVGVGVHIMAPMSLRGKLAGFLSLDFAECRGACKPENLLLLKLFGEMLIGALDRRRTETALLENEENLTITLQSIGDAVIATDTEGRVTRMNFIAEQLTGWTSSEALGRRLSEVFHIVNADSRRPLPNPVDRVLQEGKVVELADDTILIGRYGAEHRIADSGAPIRSAEGFVVGVVLVFRDISERHSLEQQYRQSQRLEAVGQLSGGVAHDFNNLLQVITGYLDMAMDEVSSNERAVDDLRQIRKAAERATVLVRQLLAFSRRQNMKMERLNLNDAISNLLKMLTRIIGEHIDLDFTPGFELKTALADPGQIEQVLMNLAVNSRDAMPKGGRISIETRNVSIGPEFCEQNLWARVGEYVLLSFADNGSGIASEIRGRVFEPFFTTKDVGKGTGLGLSTVYGIVKQHGGLIHLDNAPGGGALFRLYIPVAPVEKARGAMPEPAARDLSTAPFSNCTILLAEDDPMVRGVALRMLQKAGCRIIVATNGEEAIRLFNEHASEVDLALLDVMMPKASGREVADHIRAANPSIPILFCTGYDYNLIDVGLSPGDGVRMVHKPYERQSLLGAVREMLESRNRPARE
jgi:PAS domain S-box-containing protein